MKRTALLFLMMIFFLFPAVLCAQSELLGKADVVEITWGGIVQEWGRVQAFGEDVDLFATGNVRMARGSEGQYSVILRDNSPTYTGNTELLLHFDRATRTHVWEKSEHYEIDGVSIFPSQDIEKHGQGSAGFLRYGNSIRIRPLPGSVFFDDEPLQSFSIDFHLYPINVHDSVVVLSWYAPTVDAEQGFSGIRAYFLEGRLHWEFGNVFHETHFDFEKNGLPTLTPHAMVVGELDRTPLNEWHHHALHYDAQTGLVTLRFDGRESNLHWATVNRREDGTVLKGRFSHHIGVPMILGDHYLGYIDEFRISRGSRAFTQGEYVLSGKTDTGDEAGYIYDSRESSSEKGFLISDVIDLKNRGTEIISMSWDGEEENGTAIRLFFRSSNEYFAPDTDYRKPHHDTDPDDYVSSFMDWRKTVKSRPWVPVRNGNEISVNNRGRYFQWMAVLIGTDGLYTPVLHNLGVSVEPNMPPAPPILLAAEPVSGGIELTWIRNKEKDVTGYYVYFGNRSGYYVGNIPEFVPVQDSGRTGDTRTHVLQGLRNEDVYFVSITAVDEEGQESDFSRELIARPSALYSRK